MYLDCRQISIAGAGAVDHTTHHLHPHDNIAPSAAEYRMKRQRGATRRRLYGFTIDAASNEFIVPSSYLYIRDTSANTHLKSPNPAPPPVLRPGIL